MHRMMISFLKIRGVGMSEEKKIYVIKDWFSDFLKRPILRMILFITFFQIMVTVLVFYSKQ